MGSKVWHVTLDGAGHSVRLADPSPSTKTYHRELAAEVGVDDQPVPLVWEREGRTMTYQARFSIAGHIAWFVSRPDAGKVVAEVGRSALRAALLAALVGPLDAVPVGGGPYRSISLFVDDTEIEPVRVAWH